MKLKIRPQGPLSSSPPSSVVYI